MDDFVTGQYRLANRVGRDFALALNRLTTRTFEHGFNFELASYLRAIAEVAGDTALGSTGDESDYWKMMATCAEAQIRRLDLDDAEWMRLGNIESNELLSAAIDVLQRLTNDRPAQSRLESYASLISIDTRNAWRRTHAVHRIPKRSRPTRTARRVVRSHGSSRRRVASCSSSSDREPEPPAALAARQFARLAPTFAGWST